MQSALVCLNRHRQEMVLAFFPPKFGKSTVNIDDKPLNDTAYAFSPDPHHQEASSLRDSDRHLFSARFLIACCLESLDV